MTVQSRPPISGINHVNLYSNKLEEIAEFYGNVLGLKLVVAIVDDFINGQTTMEDEQGRLVNNVGGMVKPRHYMFEISPTNYIAFFDQGEEFDGPHGGFHHIAFAVDSDADFDAAVEALRAHGVATSPVMDYGPFKSCYFVDPEGRNLEFTCQKRMLGLVEDFTDPNPLPVAQRALSQAKQEVPVGAA
ncbi:VOC family protein [Streptomyces sp. NPDC085932]|uniref:VOC family protein n=1 Tax=Streptomyces sp. NPDC085932 TaxID=3365741 RepID=UPI0037D8176C